MHKKILIAICFILPLGYFIFTTYIEPRPFYILETDTEIAYYANGLMIREGIRQSDIPGEFNSHPGTPVRYLSALIIKGLGNNFEKVKEYFDIGHFLTALITGISLYLFVRLLLKNEQFRVAFPILAILMAWPSFPFYLGYFGSEQFVFAFGLITISFLFKSFENKFKPNIANILICGVGIGICLALKLTFIPVAVAMIAAASVHILVSARKSKNILKLFLLPFSAIATFIIVNLPVLYEIPKIISWNYQRPHKDMQSVSMLLHDTLGTSIRTFLKEFIDVSLALLKINTSLTIIIVIVIAVYLFVIGSYFYRKLTNIGISSDDDNFDHISCSVMTLLLLTGFLYILSLADIEKNIQILELKSWGSDPGLALRNVYPSVLFLPIMMLHISRLNKIRNINTDANKKLKKAFNIILIIGSLIAIIVTFLFHIIHRNDFIQNREKRNAEIGKLIESYHITNGRIAFYDGDCEGIFQEASAFFYIDNRYIQNKFNSILIEKFPKYAYFRLLNIIHEKNYQGLIIENEESDRVGLIVFSEDKFRYITRSGIMEFSELIHLIDQRFGYPTIKKHKIYCEKWIFIILNKTILDENEIKKHVKLFT